MTCNERVKYLRQMNNMTLKDVAARLNTTEATIQRYESGTQIKSISYEKIVAYAELFGVSPSYIMGWEDKPEEEIGYTKHIREFISVYQGLSKDKQQAVDSFLYVISNSEITIESKLDNNSMMLKKYSEYINAFEKMSSEKQETIKNLFNVLKE